MGLLCVITWPAFLFLVLPQVTVPRYTWKMAQVSVHLQVMLLRKEGGQSVSGSSPSPSSLELGWGVATWGRGRRVWGRRP